MYGRVTSTPVLPAPEPGVQHVWRHEADTVIPQRRSAAIADVARRLGVDRGEVQVTESLTPAGHRRIVAWWMP